ncbi:MAG: aminotransferase class III-fold pyridoxal phosphate-dependent enzyme [Desulfovermiculus sp.]|nr:aminotransferase class III-fold pyridoxal phosphate-dependent enzyme [Desulfovermiculus sp.]
MTNNQPNPDVLFYQSRTRLPVIQRSEGIYIWDEDGKEYIDGCSGAMICNIGHSHPRILEAINHQAESTFFAYRTQFENRPSLDLAQTLVQEMPDGLNRVFFVSGGSEAVESALKICRQHFWHTSQKGRHIFISRTPSYHGASMGALSMTSYAPLEIPFRPMFQAYPKIPAPYCYRCPYHKNHPECGLECAWALEKTILEQGPESVAAFVIEPIGGASTGALVPPDGYFEVIQNICRKYGIMLILDEVMTGFGRTGAMFAMEHWGVQPDIVALSKGMGSGYIPLGGVLTSKEIVDPILAGGGFMHGFTSAGNPMACAVGLEVLKILKDQDLVINARERGEELLSGLRELAQRHPIIGQVRGKGLLTAIELVQDWETHRPFPPEKGMNSLLTKEAARQGLIIYPRRPINGLRGDHVTHRPAPDRKPGAGPGDIAQAG